MRAGPRDWVGLARSLVIYRCRPWKTRALARLYAEILRPGDLAFDIGAHAGNRTRAMLAAGARVVALEPQPLFHAWLARDLPKGVTLLRAAAGADPGRGRLAISRLHPTVTSLVPGFAETMAAAPGFGYVRWDAEAEVDVTTLDALIAREGRPRFIKIDVEGGEATVLAGLSAPVDWIAFEALPTLPGVTTAALARLGTLGAYEFNFIPGEQNRFALADWTGAAGIEAALDRFGRSGDVYARLATRDGATRG
jgi:FkbM family methyltransferase